MKQCIALLVASCALIACSRSVSHADENIREQLIASSQAILDAITAGDRSVFERTLDPEGIFVDEEGNVRDGRELTAEIRRLPPGYVGNLRMVDPKVRITGDTAVLTYDIAETLKLYGQRLDTRFHTTDVYQRRSDRWRLIASHVSVFPSELDPVAVDPAIFKDYEGEYRLGDDVTARVWTEDGKLYMQRQGRDREELLPIGNDRFIRRKATRGERFFRRDSTGRVIGLVDRRDNNDLVWRRSGG